MYGLVFVLMLLATPALAQLSVQESGGSKTSEIPDVTVTSTATLIDAADGRRVNLNCTNHDESVAVRWGSSAVTATSGQRFPVNGTIEIKNTGAIYMISEDAAVTVSCTRELQ
jgi:hypothetical protein